MVALSACGDDDEEEEKGEGEEVSGVIPLAASSREEK